MEARDAPAVPAETVRTSLGLQRKDMPPSHAEPAQDRRKKNMSPKRKAVPGRSESRSLAQRDGSREQMRGVRENRAEARAQSEGCSCTSVTLTPVKSPAWLKQ